MAEEKKPKTTITCKTFLSWFTRALGLMREAGSENW